MTELSRVGTRRWWEVRLGPQSQAKEPCDRTQSHGL